MTPQQKRLLDYLRGFQPDGVQPSISEMCAHMGRRGRSSVHGMLKALEAVRLAEQFKTGDRCWRAVVVDPFARFKDEDLVAELDRRGYKGSIDGPFSGDRRRFFRLDGGAA